MNRERAIIITEWIIMIIMLIKFIPRSRVREAHVAFLFKQLLTWLLGLAVVEFGLIVMAEVIALLLQLYVVAPEAVSVVEPPKQITALPLIATVGKLYTLMFTDCVLLHPVANAP